MANVAQATGLLERLRIKRFDRKETCAVIRGERLPEGFGVPLLRLCTIRGIRYNDRFGEELRGLLPQFTRALNARDIMSNRIPEIANLDEETPYCIWHPEIASEETYRQLVKKYPHMAYQVGRACAVAGYTDLFLELDILPECHVAEEARESGNLAIYEQIMTQPVKFNVMNDYDRTINSKNPKPGYLNGDTAVRSTLEDKQAFSKPTIYDDDDDEHLGFGLFDDDGYTDNMFNITEDMNIHDDAYDIYLSNEGFGEVTPEKLAHSKLMIELLTNPLPTDLPTMDKDPLIAMAAYNGDMERYSRLRRPKLVSGEIQFCVHGIYHNTMFAVWCSKQDHLSGDPRIQEAVCARFIMNNVLSKVPALAERPYPHFPYLIWYPNTALPSTYRALAKMAPKMMPQILRACIYADYKDLFDNLISETIPDDAILKEASISPNPHYRDTLQARIEVVGKIEIGEHERWKLNTYRDLDKHDLHDLDKPAAVLGPTYWDQLLWGSATGCFYNGYYIDGSETEQLVCLPDEWKVPLDHDIDFVPLDYVKWPPKVQKEEEVVIDAD